MVPGWRAGWVVFQDNVHGSIEEVRRGAVRLAQVVLGCSRLVQSVIPAVLCPEDADAGAVEAWRADAYGRIEAQASHLCRLLDGCPGLEVVWPEGGE